MKEFLRIFDDDTERWGIEEEKYHIAFTIEKLGDNLKKLILYSRYI